LKKARTSKIPRRDEQRLLTYAAAAGAALAATGTADAAIVQGSTAFAFVPTTVNLADGPLLLNIGGADRLSFYVGRGTWHSGYVQRKGAASLLQISSSSDNMRNVAKSSPIGPGVTFWGAYANGVLFSTTGDSSGAFATSVTRTSGYMGFRFPAAVLGGFDYGWVQITDVSIDGNNPLNSFKVADWAYEDTGLGILAGGGAASGGPSGGGGGGSDGGSVGAPEPGTVLMGLSALAIGAGYRMRQWRRKRA